MTKMKMSRLTEALLEMAADQHRIGMMDDATYREIVARHCGEDATVESSECGARASDDKIRKRKDRSTP